MSDGDRGDGRKDGGVRGEERISANYGLTGDWSPSPGSRPGTEGSSASDADDVRRQDYRPQEGFGVRGGWTGPEGGYGTRVEPSDEPHVGRRGWYGAAEGGSFLGDYQRPPDYGPEGFYEGRWETHRAYGQGGWGGPGGYGGTSRPNYRGPGGRARSHGFWGGGQFAGSPPDYDTTPHAGEFAGRGPKNWRRADERVLEDVCDHLTMHGEVDASDIEVRVEGGEVTLTGTVTDRWQKRVAEDVAEQCLGVTEVHNDLRLKKPDEELTARGQTKTGRRTPVETT
jgi:hypothetical protein